MRSCITPAILCVGIVAVTSVASAQQPAPDAKLDPAIFDPYLGTYQLPSGRFLIVGRTERRLYAYEPESGRLRGLERVDDRTWVAGPSLLIFAPEVYRLTFVKDAVQFTDRGKPAVLATKARLYREESVEFENGIVTLSGTLFLPTGKGPHPAIVLAHGSGAQDRNGYLANIRLLADHLARQGIAVLTYDKRGSGRSTGRWETASFADLEGDLIAGIRLLRARSDIISTQVGAGGSSQAGWVVAKAVTQSPDIAFVILIGAAGSGYRVTEQNLYNTEAEMRAAGVSEDRITRALDLQRRFFEMLRRGESADAREYDEAVRIAREDSVLRNWIFPISSEVDWRNRNAWYTALEVDFDPLPAWRAYKGPVLAIFGELDAQTPVAAVVPRITESLMTRRGSDFTISVFANASHLMLEATRASDDELDHLRRMVPGFYELVSEWLKGRLQRSSR
jgi:pimeloyl-ACP methyl ester carboxylesterase